MDDFIEVYDGVLEPRACRELIAKFETSPHVGAGQTGHGVDPTRKDSRDLAISMHPEFAALCEEVTDRARACLVEYVRKYPFALMGHLAPEVVDPETERRVAIGPDNFQRLAARRLPELLQRMYRFTVLNVQKYAQGSGGYHHWHSEIYPLDAGAETLHRCLFFQFYLNDVELGGETEFFHQRRQIAPRTGRFLVAPAGFTHTHKGHVPRSGDNYVLTSWLLFQRAEWLYGQS